MSNPLVTIGVPVFNEGEFLRESLECLIAQTYPNIKILIADNGSSDSTEALCREYAANNEHIRYIRHPENIGQHKNFNYLVREASGTYFVWASGHDLWEPTFIADSVTVLESDPNIVLAYPRTMNMTRDGKMTREKVRPFDIRKMSPAKRFREVMWRVDCNYVYGVWRLEPMQQSKLFQGVVALDRVFLAEMAAKGTFAPVDTMKYYRMSRTHQQTELDNRRRTMGYIYPEQTFSDKELMSAKYFKNTRTYFFRAAKDAKLGLYTYFSIWLCGVMKFSLLPGGLWLSKTAKKLLPGFVLRALMRRMQ